MGDHAESLLSYCDINRLILVDVWLNPICEGYCEGRLGRWRNKFKMHKGKSFEAVKAFEDNYFDFIYLDQEHDYISVREDLNLWWCKLKEGGVMSLRNYAVSNEGLKRAADEFVNNKKHEIIKSCAEIIIFK